MTTYVFKFYDSLGDVSQHVTIEEASSFAVAVTMAKRISDLPFWKLVAKLDEEEDPR